MLEHLVPIDDETKLPGFEHADLETTMSVLEQFGAFCADVLAPLNRVGDVQRATFDHETGAVVTPPGWVDAYRKYVDAGWPTVPHPVEDGGGGFPWLAGLAMDELLGTACMAFSLCPLLTQSGIGLLARHGDEIQRELYMRRMITGEWPATMNLTEPHAGSDVGAVTTRAQPAADGTWRITGQKIFITYGEHDLSANIVHLVLARVPDAPPGTKGISCFVVPKLLDDGDGSFVVPNAVRCIGIEHKLGIHGSPTCTLEYDGAVGFLDRRAERRDALHVHDDEQGAPVGGRAGAQPRRARVPGRAGVRGERRQGRAPGAPAGESSPIVEHPDVRRMLVHMRSHIEAMRALAYTNAAALDVATHGDRRGRSGAQPGAGRPAHPGHEGVVHRSRFGAHPPRDAGLRRRRVHRGDGRRAVRARRPHRRDLRGDERHPGRRPRDEEDPDAWWRRRPRAARVDRDDGRRPRRRPARPLRGAPGRPRGAPGSDGVAARRRARHPRTGLPARRRTSGSSGPCSAGGST